MSDHTKALWIVFACATLLAMAAGVGVLTMTFSPRIDGNLHSEITYAICSLRLIVYTALFVIVVAIVRKDL